MQGFVGFLFFVALFAFIAVIAAMTHRQTTNQLLERVADRFRGRIIPGGFWDGPEVRLQFEGHPAVLRFKHVAKNLDHTVFSIAWPDRDLRCEIYPQDIFSGFRKLLGMEDIEIGSPQFDATYFICGNSREEVRELLSAEVQSIVFRLATLSS